jgi:hypothetical protein
MIAAWEDIFEPYPVPKWLVSFDQDPKEAVDALLWGRYYFAHLNTAVVCKRGMAISNLMV